MSSLPPILYRRFACPLPYAQTLALQHKLHEYQLSRRRASQDHPDLLLLLEHRPVYTGGRRQKTEELEEERKRLEGLGADWVATDRGGQTTYHGPGQITGYPLLDLGRMGVSIRDYICQLQKTLLTHVREKHNIAHFPSEHTGLFIGLAQKMGSIGVQVRHRLTTHGFALNVTNEPLRWFDEVVACGMADVRAVSIGGALEKDVSIQEEMDDVAEVFGRVTGREVRRMSGEDDEVSELLLGLEEEARRLGGWEREPSRKEVQS